MQAITDILFTGTAFWRITSATAACAADQKKYKITDKKLRRGQTRKLLPEQRKRGA